MLQNFIFTREHEVKSLNTSLSEENIEKKADKMLEKAKVFQDLHNFWFETESACEKIHLQTQRAS